MSFVYDFREELQHIREGRIKDFTVDALEMIPEFVANARIGNSTYVNYIKRVFEITNDICDMLNVEDYTRDAMLSVALLHDMTRFDMLDEYNIVEDITHPLTVRQCLFSLQGALGREDFDGLMRIIEASHGFQSIVPQVQPMMNDPIQMWILPIASYLATKESGIN